MKSKRPESAIQFDAIWKEYNDPEERAKRKLLENRKKRAETNKSDKGL